MPKVRVKRAFYGVEKNVRAGDVIEVAADRAKALEKKGLVEIMSDDTKQSEAPKTKQAAKPQNKQAPAPADKAAEGSKD